MENKKYIYLVRQTQPMEDYQATTIAVFDNKKDAYDLARQLNKTYGQGVVFDDNYDFIEYTCETDDIHYYDVEKKLLNPNKEIFL